MFRIFASFSIISQIKKIFKQIKEGSGNQIANLSLFASQVVNFVFFFVDNVSVLSLIKFLEFNDQKLQEYAFKLYGLGLLNSFIFNLAKLKQSYNSENQVKKQVVSMTLNQFVELLQRYSHERKKYFINALRNVCDIIISLDKMDIPKKILFTNLNKGLVAVSGLTSSIISIYAAYSKNMLSDYEENLSKFN